MKRILATLISLAFAAIANAAGQAETPAFTSGINFDELSVGDFEYSGDTNWLWQSTSADDELRVTAWGSETYSGDRPDNGGATNYLKIETEFSTPLYRGIVGFEKEATSPSQKKIEDQLYFDSLVYLTPGDPSTYVDSLPEDAKIAVWLQEAEDEDDDPVLCVRAGYRAKEVTVDNKVKTYACSIVDGGSVSTGWHRLTIRCFENIMWTTDSASSLPAYVVYLDGKALTTSEPRFEEGMVDVDGMVPKCLALNKAGALFLSMKDDSTSVGAVGFAGSGAVDDIIFTDKRPGFLTAADDINYLRLGWDENVAAVKYIVNSGAAQEVSDISGAGSTDIALADGGQTIVEVMATYAASFGPGTWLATGASVAKTDDGGTFTVTAEQTRPIGKIVSASAVPVATATVTIGEKATTLSATTLSALADQIGASLQSEGSDLPDSATVYIRLVEDQTVVLSGTAEDAVGQAFLGTSKEVRDGEYAVVAGIVWTLDLNGKTITVGGDLDAAPIICDGMLTVTDTSETAAGAIVRSAASLPAIGNQGNLTIAAGRFVGRIGNLDATAPAVFNGGKYMIIENDAEYLTFLNEHKGEAVAEFAADDAKEYYVASEKEPEPAVAVAKIGDAEYETIQAALDAAVKAGEATVDVIASVEIADSLFISGSGVDATKITVNVDKDVTVTSTANYGLYIDRAKVTLGGAGQWVKKANGGLILVGEKSAAAHLVVDGATIIATAGGGIDGASRVINVQNGAVTVKSGLIQNDYIYGCCVRSEDSEVTNVSDGTTIIVEGGTLTVPTIGSFAPVIVKNGSSTENNKIYISVEGKAKFAGAAATICGEGAMEGYLAAKDESGAWGYTSGYKFELGSDGYYAVVVAYEPMDAGSEQTCDDEAAAEALKKAIEADKTSMINTPTDPSTGKAPDDFDKSAYVGLFEVKVSTSETQTGKYVVAVVLTAEATAAIQAQVDAYGDLDLKALASAMQTATLDTSKTPGIYYTVFYGTTPTAIDSHDDSVLATAATTTLKFPTQGSIGFYRVKATVRPIAE